MNVDLKFVLDPVEGLLQYWSDPYNVLDIKHVMPKVAQAKQRHLFKKNSI